MECAVGIWTGWKATKLARCLMVILPLYAVFTPFKRVYVWLAEMLALNWWRGKRKVCGLRSSTDSGMVVIGIPSLMLHTTKKLRPLSPSLRFSPSHISCMHAKFNTLALGVPSGETFSPANSAISWFKTANFVRSVGKHHKKNVEMHCILGTKITHCFLLW